MKQTIQKKSYTKRKKINNSLLIAGFSFHFLSHLNFYVDIISATILELFFGIVWCK